MDRQDYDERSQISGYAAVPFTYHGVSNVSQSAMEDHKPTLGKTKKDPNYAEVR